MINSSTTAAIHLTAGWLLLLSLGCAPPEPELPETADPSRYHILVTNDDGIESPGIRELADALRSVGEVTVVAPCGQMSGSSMSVGLGREHRLRAVGEQAAQWGHCIEATPADAVLLAIEALAPEGGFDLVVSGINAGANTGDLGHMSGTVGAAMMGAFYDIPAVAASLGGQEMDFGYAAAFTAHFVGELKQRPPLPGAVLSVNFPAASEDAIGGEDGRGLLLGRVRGGGPGRGSACLSSPLRVRGNAPAGQRFRGVRGGHDHDHAAALRLD